MFRYLDTSELAYFQDTVILSKEISESQARSSLKELKRWGLLFSTSFFGLNPIAYNNLAIRQELICAKLNRILGNNDKSIASKIIADRLFRAQVIDGFYVEGFSYFLYVKGAYEFYYKDSNLEAQPQAPIDLTFLQNMHSNYQKIAAPDGSVPVNDTSYLDNVVPAKKDFSNELYTVKYLDSDTFIFISHNKNNYKQARRGHVNLDFGHFAIYNKGVWVVLHKWYPGYSLKTSSDLKETYNENIIQIGAHSKESVWRYLPFKPELSYIEIEDSHIFDIEFTASRNITIDKKHKQVKVTDFGGVSSSFNISDICSYGISMTDQFSIETGYHSYTRTSVQTHKRLELSGAVRSITFNLS